MTDTISNQPVNIVQHLSAKEPDIFPSGIGRDQKVKREGMLDLHSKHNSNAKSNCLLTSFYLCHYCVIKGWNILPLPPSAQKNQLLQLTIKSITYKL